MTFEKSRSDGRSNADVLIALVRDAQPGRVYPYAELSAALAAGSPRIWMRRDVQAAVRTSTPRMLREVQRLFHAIPNIGYRLAESGDHSRLALVRERKSMVQLKNALQVLRHARFDEMTPTQRTFHEAHLTVTAALCAQQALVQKRQQQQDDAIAALCARVDRLETS